LGEKRETLALQGACNGETKKSFGGEPRKEISGGGYWGGDGFLAEMNASKKARRNRTDIPALLKVVANEPGY